MSRIEQLNQFLETSPDDAFLIHALALELVKTEDFKNAALAFEKNLRINPQYIATYFHLGKLYEKMGKQTAALDIYDRGMDTAQAAGDRKTYNEIFLAKDFLEDEMD